MRLGIATDHGGFALKDELVPQLRAAGHEVIDFGAQQLNNGDDYPDFVVPLAQAVAAGKVERGVAICGSGVGASVCANNQQLDQLSINTMRTFSIDAAQSKGPRGRGTGLRLGMGSLCWIVGSCH
jgi:RpiB/LacA/LacB family sugar-phosphate isomerase